MCQCHFLYNVNLTDWLVISVFYVVIFSSSTAHHEHCNASALAEAVVQTLTINVDLTYV